MASLLEEIADSLARDVIRASQELKDDDLVAEISKVIGASSPTTQEAFVTAVRVRLAEARARKALAEKLGKSSWDEVVASTAPPAMTARLEAVSAPTTAVMTSEVASSVAPERSSPAPALPMATPEPRPASALVRPASMPVPAPAAEASGSIENVAPPAAGIPSPRTQVRRVMPRAPVEGAQAAAASPPGPPRPTEPTLSSSAPTTSSLVVGPEARHPSLAAALSPPSRNDLAPTGASEPAISANKAQDQDHVSGVDASGQGTHGLPHSSPSLLTAAPEPAPVVASHSEAAHKIRSNAEPETLVGKPVRESASPSAPEQTPMPGSRTPESAELPAPEAPPVMQPVQHPPGSLAEALARAAAMPKPKIAPPEPKGPVVNPYSDIEMPDGDWG